MEEQATFGKRMQAARRMSGYRTQQALADVLGVSERTVRNYETDKWRPDVGTLSVLRRLLGPFDEDGDDVEMAVRRSRLTEDRQYAVIGTYKRHLREQDDDEGGRRGA